MGNLRDILKDGKKHQGKGVLRFEDKEILRISFDGLGRSEHLTQHDGIEYILEVYEMDVKWDLTDDRFIAKRKEIEEKLKKIGGGDRFDLELEVEGVGKEILKNVQIPIGDFKITDKPFTVKKVTLTKKIESDDLSPE